LGSVRLRCDGDVIGLSGAGVMTTVLAVPHPEDGYDAWRAGWADVVKLVDEIGRMVRTAG
jgi:hypothetical protein